MQAQLKEAQEQKEIERKKAQNLSEELNKAKPEMQRLQSEVNINNTDNAHVSCISCSNSKLMFKKSG